MVNCLVGCVSQFQCGAVAKPEDGYIVTPFVKVKFKGSGLEISVGNKPSPSKNNLAIIKSMEYGGSNGFEIVLEIVDQQGGSMTNVVNAMTKCITGIDAPRSHVEVEFGWIITDCSGAVTVKRSPKITGSCTNLECEMTGGLNKYRITATAVASLVVVGRGDIVYGTDDEKGRMHLKDAIEKLAKDSPPKFSKVKYSKLNPDSSVGTWVFKDDPKGPKGKWAGDSMDKLMTINTWLSPYVTKDNKGIHASADPTDPTILVLWEDTTEAKIDCSRSIGTYIVNGGSCSRVIEFQPKFNWPQAWQVGLTTGGATGPMNQSAELVEKKADPKLKDCQTKEAGAQTYIVTPADIIDKVGPKEAIQQMNSSQQKHYKANEQFVGHTSAIEANLVIQGDPRPELVLIQERSYFRPVSIVLINPYGVFSSGRDCEWLAAPGCNEVLSNKNWRIKGVNHTIKEGSYTTTIQVMLQAPAIDLAVTAPFGGEGFTSSGG